MFLLKANSPRKFGDKIEQTHKGTGAAVRVYSVDDPETVLHLPENGREAPDLLAAVPQTSPSRPKAMAGLGALESLDDSKPRNGAVL